MKFFTWMLFFFLFSEIAHCQKDEDEEKFIPFWVEEYVPQPKKSKKTSPQHKKTEKKDNLPEQKFSGDLKNLDKNNILGYYLKKEKNFLNNDASTPADDAEDSDDTFPQKVVRSIKKVATSSVKDLIETFKKDLCPINPNGQFEVTISVDLSGKLLGVGASAEGGIKVIINCNK